MQKIIFSLLFVLLYAFQAQAVTVSFQDGVAGYSGTEDTYVHETFPGANFGANTALRADGADNVPPGEVATLTKWDISSIPAAAVVTAVTVSFEFFNTSAGAYNLHPQNSPWTEGTAVWADLNSGAGVLGTIAPGSGGVTNIFLNAAGLALVQNWVTNPANNEGIAIRTAGSNDGIAARSREAAAFHPRLEVTYNAGAPTNAQLLAMIQALQNQLNTINNTFQNVQRIGDDLYFDKMNVHVRNGMDATNGNPGVPNNPSQGQVNGLGNLIVGYNEASATTDKSGSHNLIVGNLHSYPSFGALVAGSSNAVEAPYTSVSGGYENHSMELYSSVSGGIGNLANGVYSSVNGGVDNEASGKASNISGGAMNVASGGQSFVAGGGENSSIGPFTSVLGGNKNTARADYSAVSGGQDNRAAGDYSTVTGGRDNLVAGDFASISGGWQNAASGDSSTVTGGFQNTASGVVSSVSGGSGRTAPGPRDWAAGSLWEDF